MFTNAKSPRWANADRAQIVLDVLFIGEVEYSQFVASPNDCTTHGPMLYNFATNGLFGPVADSDEERILRGEIDPPEGHMLINGEIVNIATVEEDAQAKLNRLLAELQTPEALARAEVDEEYAIERKTKLTALLAVKQQPGWPTAVEWPE